MATVCSRNSQGRHAPQASRFHNFCKNECLWLGGFPFPEWHRNSQPNHRYHYNLKVPSTSSFFRKYHRRRECTVRLLFPRQRESLCSQTPSLFTLPFLIPIH